MNIENTIYLNQAVSEERDELLDHLDKLRVILLEARDLIHRYRTETPIGYQPHMIAERADHWLASNSATTQGKVER
jgi:hypothetical protein